MDYKKYCIDTAFNLREAMKQLDKAAKKILFITSGNKLKATLTDGDLRRFLLKGGTLDEPVMKAANPNMRTASDYDSAISLLESGLNLPAVPIINKNGEIINILFASTSYAPLHGALKLPVVIMAGGKGTRLDPYTRILPKPLIPVGDLPIIEHIMQEFEKYDCKKFHVIVNYKKQFIKTYFAESDHKYNTLWYDEAKPLGTGGGLYMLKNEINETFFLTNCDILVLDDYEKILQFHREQHNTITMVCALKSFQIPYGVVKTGADGQILSMQEKPEFSFQTNTGMYIAEPEILNDIKPKTEISFPEIIEAQKQKNRKVGAYPVSEHNWLDMGQLAQLEKMRERLYGK